MKKKNKKTLVMLSIIIIVIILLVALIYIRYINNRNSIINKYKSNNKYQVIDYDEFTKLSKKLKYSSVTCEESEYNKYCISYLNKYDDNNISNQLYIDYVDEKYNSFSNSLYYEKKDFSLEKVIDDVNTIIKNFFNDSINSKKFYKYFSILQEEGSLNKSYSKDNYIFSIFGNYSEDEKLYFISITVTNVEES